MKTNTQTILLLAALTLTSCVPSWNPLYTEKDLVFDPALLGSWKPAQTKPESKETWVFTKSAERVYALEQTDEEGNKASFEVRLVKLGAYRFLDLYLSKVEGDNPNLNAWACFSLAPAHLILKVEQTAPTLKIAAMNPTWIKEHLKQRPTDIAHRVVMDGSIILTASTEDLQKFVLEHVGGEEFFGGPMELKQINQ